MIRITVEDTGGIDLVLADEKNMYQLMGSRPVERVAYRRRGLALPWVAALLIVAAGGGYLLSPSSHRAQATAPFPTPLSAQTPPDLIPPAPSPMAMPQPTVNAQGAGAVAAALQEQPTVTPPPPSAPAEKTPGTAAFGLQP